MADVASRLPTLLGDLRANHPFLRLLTGRLVTNAGDSLYYVAAMWLVFDLTGSPLFTGIAGFMVQAPSALSFLTGPLVDRWPLRRVLVGTQALNGLLVLIIPLAAWTGHLSVWVVLAVLPVVTMINQFVYPAQNAALPRMVAEENLARANSLLSAAFQGADMVFNALSGLLIAVIGAVSLFVVDSVTFGLALVTFLGIRVPDAADAGTRGTAGAADAAGEDAPAGADSTEAESAESAEAKAGETAEAAEIGETEGYLAELRAGFAYIRGSLVIALVAGAVLANFTAGAMLGVMPAFAATMDGPNAFGLLMAAYAGGTLAGTLLASTVEDRPLGRFTVRSQALSGVVLVLALSVGWFPATLGLFFLTFVPVGAFNVLFWTMLQSAVDEDLLGRVTSLITSVASVAVPVGSVLGGAVAGVYGSRLVMGGWVVGSLSFAAYFAIRPSLRRLPPAAEVDGARLGLGDRVAPGTAEDGPEPSGVGAAPE